MTSPPLPTCVLTTLLCAGALLLAGPASATTYTVNSTADTARCDAIECTLRGALTEANASVGVSDRIRFRGAGGPMVFTPGTWLPDIVGDLQIDGFSCSDCGGVQDNGNDPEDGLDSVLG